MARKQQRKVIGTHPGHLGHWMVRLFALNEVGFHHQRALSSILAWFDLRLKEPH